MWAHDPVIAVPLIQEEPRVTIGVRGSMKHECTLHRNAQMHSLLNDSVPTYEPKEKKNLRVKSK